AASLILRLLVVSTPTSPSPLWRYSLLTTFFFFVAGMLLALLRLEWENAPPQRLAGAAGRTDVWLLATIPLWLLIVRRYDWEALAAATGFLTVGACVLPLRPGPLMRFLEWRPLAVVGIASYSLYIWHVPILHAITGDTKPSYGYVTLAAFAVPMCVAVALASYVVVEAPFLRLRRRLAQG